MTDDDTTMHDDPYDPVIAERFSLLQGANPPELPTMLTSKVERPTVRQDDDRSDRVPFYLMAAAAGVTFLAGVGLILAVGNRGGDVAAGDPAGSRIQTDAADIDVGRDTSELRNDDGEPTGDRAVVEVPAGDPEGAEDPATPPDDEPEPTESTTSSTTTTSTVSSIDRSEETLPTKPLPSESIPVDPDGPTVTLPFDPAPTISPFPEPDPDSDDGLFMVEGRMLELYTDCEARLSVKDATDEIIRGTGGSCDGGSHIMVDGRRIQTASGFGLPSDAFDKHPDKSMLGEEVTVIAVAESNGSLTLNCSQCGVSLSR